MYAQHNPLYFYLNQRSHVVSLNLYMGPINMYRNEDIHLIIGVTLLIKGRENRLTWFGMCKGEKLRNL